MTENLELRARAICAADLDAAHMAAKGRAAAVERYWPVVAAEITRAAADHDDPATPTDLAVRVLEYRRLLRR